MKRATLGVQFGRCEEWATQHQAFVNLAPFFRFNSKTQYRDTDKPDQATYSDGWPSALPDGKILWCQLANVLPGRFDTWDGEGATAATQTFTQNFARGVIPPPRFTRLDAGDGLLTDAFKASMEPFAAGVIRFMIAQGLNITGAEGGTHPYTWRDLPTQEGKWGYAGIPPRVLCGVARELGMTPWFCISPKATDEYVDYYLRTLAREYPAGEIVLENGNEIWNGQYEWSAYYKSLGATDWQGVLEMHTARTAWLGERAKAIIGDRATIVLGCQVAGYGTCPDALPAGIDAIAIAPYWYMSAQTVDGIFAEVPASMEQVGVWLTHWRAKADALGVKLLAYESGPHDWKGANAAAVLAAQQDPRMFGVHRGYLDVLSQYFREDEHVVLHCLCLPEAKLFGLVNTLDKMDTPKWMATMDWLGEHPNVVADQPQPPDPSEEDEPTVAECLRRAGEALIAASEAMEASR